MNLSSEEAQFLSQIAFVGNNHGMFRESRVIFEGIVAFAPDNEWSNLGLATALLQGDDPEQARVLLEETVLDKNPNNAIALAYLGLTYRSLNKLERSRELFQQIVDQKDADENARALASALLEASKPITSAATTNVTSAATTTTDAKS